ncbi:MAG: TonB-dependent receptor plug domain-containing protein [Mangrovimonas sp.]|nr:TonB-dependent receptor plug domain-containing protein [Mangrovimonas sp.]MCB0434538.1 TonB-dependent receptor plug domain-containing protein [Mangrovimonas sp.]MCB0439642.1 TonB-dependent receptor plug domain-containing protein [Mangrovimonas sp.]MCB0466277.1 TonB-dependent receptor plug domain-containing protein [Aequorivita sp.]
MKKIILGLSLTFSLSFSILAQTDLKGKVQNANNEPLPDVYVYNLNSKSHAHSLENGVFILDHTKVGDSLEFGLLGYERLRIQVKNEDFKIAKIVVLKEKYYELDELILNQQLNTVSTISKLDLEITPVNSSQEILRKVPGLIIGQHAGGGKAEQMFLRGFDIDHGTDIKLAVDGMPVNMVSHAHGQGYSDLHFLIPETIDKIDFGKGPYYVDKGDFDVAGYVDFYTKDQLKESTVSFSLGQFNTLRTLGLINLTGKNSTNNNAYVAVEYLEGDGPFESPQNFNRLNVMGKWTNYSKNNDKTTISLSHFTSRWDASGQIPQRAVDSGLITRFGAIDDTEGGETSRSNINVEYFKHLSDETQFLANAFMSRYGLELYSNFTFYLEDPVNGDQIRQKENRTIYGLNTKFITDVSLGDIPTSLSYGLTFRYDDINEIELSHTVNRDTTLEPLKLGDIDQTNVSGFLGAEFEFNKLKIVPALRLDYFKFVYNDKLATAYTRASETKTALSPKLDFYYEAQENLQLYLKNGIGFHSNDARVVISQSGHEILPKAYGSDLGVLWKPFPSVVINSALWYLFLEQEFVYVGDAGIVEPSGKTQRFGLDFGVRYQIKDWLFFDTDLTLNHGRSVDEPSGEDYIPLAPDFTLTGGLSTINLKGFSGGIRYRYIDDRPANEDNSIVAEGYFVTDLNANYTFNHFSLGVVIENLFDTEWNETQFATESRLFNEPDSVEEIHFTPGTPFFIKGVVSYTF